MLNAGCEEPLVPTQRVEEASGLHPLWELMTHEYNAHSWPVSMPEAGARRADRCDQPLQPKLMNSLGMGTGPESSVFWPRLGILDCLDCV